MADAYVKTFELDETDVFIDEGQQVIYEFYGDNVADYLLPDPLYQIVILEGNDPLADIQFDRVLHADGYYCGVRLVVGYNPGENGVPGDYTASRIHLGLTRVFTPVTPLAV